MTIEELGYEMPSEEEWQNAKLLFAQLGQTKHGAYLLYAIGKVLIHQQDEQPEGLELKINGIAMQVTLKPAYDVDEEDEDPPEDDL